MRPVTLKGHNRLRGALNLFELILWDSQLNVCAGDREARPPDAPTKRVAQWQRSLIGHDRYRAASMPSHLPRVSRR